MGTLSLSLPSLPKKSKSVKPDSPNATTLPPPSLPNATAPTIMYLPFGDTPLPIVSNMQLDWGLSMINSSSRSWTYRDDKLKVKLAITEARFTHFQAFAEMPVAKPAWYNNFHVAVRSNQPEDHIKLTNRIIKAGQPWEGLALRELVYGFISRAASFINDVDDGLAPLAALVFNTFDHKKGSIFMETLSNVLMSTFAACWDQKCSRSIVCLPNERDDYLPAAINLAKFVGECCKHKLLTPQDTQACARLLMSNMEYIEYVDALYYIIIHADEMLWKHSPTLVKDISEFLSGLNNDVKRIVPANRILGQRPKSYNAELRVDLIVKALLEILERT